MEKNSLGDIESYVDSLKAGRKKHHHVGKLKGMPLILGVVASIAVIASAGIMGFFWQSTTSISTDDMFLIDDYSPNEFEISQIITDAVGGNVYEFVHWVNTSAYLQDNVTLSFTWAGNYSGIDAGLYFEGSPITTLEIAPNQNYMLTERFVLDEMLSPGSYNTVLSVDVV